MISISMGHYSDKIESHLYADHLEITAIDVNALSLL